MKKKRMPVGIDNFAECHQLGYYYVDKTGMIKELLESPGKVNLFTRPRRFGKSLNMSMLKYFFEIGTDKSLFDGLAISEETELCEKYMGQFPVISITLKQVTGNTYSTAKKNLWKEIRKAAREFPVLLKSDKLDDQDKEDLDDLRNGTGLIDNSLSVLSDLLYKHYGKKVIILIDEYDAPLQRAYQKGYYNAMVDLIRQIFGYALKSNDSLYFSVLTGVMRISKESIFSDLNNPKLYTLLDDRCDEWFGFTDSEVRKILDDNGLEEYYETVKNWYDGYQIGQNSIYCPWDVVNYCDQLLNNQDKEPRNYWANVSENGIIRTFAEMADSITRDEIGSLIEGNPVNKKLVQELIYRDMTSSISNVWSVLFTTGYLTQRKRNEDGSYELIIPNCEVRDIFKTQIEQWFQEKIRDDTAGMKDFYAALDSGDAESLEDCLNYYLGASVSYMDSDTLDDKEKFYHGLLLGMLLPRKDWELKSNREAGGTHREAILHGAAELAGATLGAPADTRGKGRSDIAAFQLRTKDAFIIEIKYSREETDLPADAQKAIDQINRMQYDQYFRMRNPRTLRHYGIAFCKKLCKVVVE